MARPVAMPTPMLMSVTVRRYSAQRRSTSRVISRRRRRVSRSSKAWMTRSAVGWPKASRKNSRPTVMPAWPMKEPIWPSMLRAKLSSATTTVSESSPWSPWVISWICSDACSAAARERRSSWNRLSIFWVMVGTRSSQSIAGAVSL